MSVRSHDQREGMPAVFVEHPRQPGDLALADVATELARLAEQVAHAREINPAFVVGKLHRIEAMARTTK